MVYFKLRVASIHWGTHIFDGPSDRWNSRNSSKSMVNRIFKMVWGPKLHFLHFSGWLEVETHWKHQFKKGTGHYNMKYLTQKHKKSLTYIFEKCLPLLQLAPFTQFQKKLDLPIYQSPACSESSDFRTLPIYFLPNLGLDFNWPPFSFSL